MGVALHHIGNQSAQRREPGSTVVVGERVTLLHLLDVRGGMKFVAVVEGPAQCVGQRAADRRLAGAGHPHHDDDVNSDVRFSAHGFNVSH